MTLVAKLLILAVLLGNILLASHVAWADGPVFFGNCASITWNANTESDLAGYKLYDRVTLGNAPVLKQTFGPQITSVNCASLSFNVGQHYLDLTAFDTTNHESTLTSDVPFVLLQTGTTSVVDLHMTVVGTTNFTMAWTEVAGSDGLPASYDVRIKTPAMDNWGTAPSVTSGTCSTPVAGTTIGATKTCTITGLSLTTVYDVQLVPFSGTINTPSVVYGALSNIATATTGGSVPTLGAALTLCSDSFTRADDATGPGVNYDNNTDHPQHMQLVSNAVRDNANTGAEISEETINSGCGVFGSSQWIQMTIKTLSVDWIWGWIKLHATVLGQTGYEATFSRYPGGGIKTEIVKFVNGARTSLVSETSTTWASGDIVLFESKIDPITAAHNLTMTRNGSLLLSASDSAISGGVPGFGSYLSSGVALSAFELDNLTAGIYAVAAATSACDCDQH